MAVTCAGGGVVDALLAAGKKNVRAITRNSTSKKAKDLATRGVEVVEGDLGDTASLIKVRPWTSLGLLKSCGCLLVPVNWSSVRFLKNFEMCFEVEA